MPIAELPPITESSWSLVDMLLTEQQQTTAVEKFAQRHQDAELPLGQSHYRDLIPLAAPRAGEQYAFEVDLDLCSGCKACVAACHTLNGLEEDELWRDVGMLHGGSQEMPVIQHVTTACHHCIDPACLDGCPVLAYDKDPLTGIVRHLDDQCIGCQYCMLKCPYDVPKYSKSKGIVRKCDMCRDRLAADEAPACVQACPNQAIRIRIVDTESIIEESEFGQFLPGAPEPGYTLPTTVYKTNKKQPRNLLPADYYSASPQHGHLPLVFMLVLTQMSVGAFLVEQSLFTFFASGADGLLAPIRPMHLAAALLLGMLGLGAAVFHLGRPLYAYRALLGLRMSWLSREILAFGLFAGAATAYVLTAGLDYFDVGVNRRFEAGLGALAAATGLAAVFCSVMIYVDTRRPFWNLTMTGVKFYLTSLVLGIPLALLISLLAAGWAEGLSAERVMERYGGSLCRLLIGVAMVKLAIEGMVLLHLRSKQHTPLKRTAQLMTGELSMATLKRFFFGIVGGVMLPLVLIFPDELVRGGQLHPMFLGVATLLALVLLTVGELFERWLFFKASVAPKMPGSPAT